MGRDIFDQSIRGFCPKCLQKPLIFSAIGVIFALFLAMGFCKFHHCTLCQESPNVADSRESRESLEKSQELFESPESPHESQESLESPKNDSQDLATLAKNEFLKNGAIIDGAKLRYSAFFAKNSSYLGKKQNANFLREISALRGVKLILIVGHGCELGNFAYNQFLIERRIERVSKRVSAIFPSAIILSANKGQTPTSAHDEHTRAQERRVDVYFY